MVQFFKRIAKPAIAVVVVVALLYAVSRVPSSIGPLLPVIIVVGLVGYIVWRSLSGKAHENPGETDEPVEEKQGKEPAQRRTEPRSEPDPVEEDVEPESDPEPEPKRQEPRKHRDDLNEQFVDYSNVDDEQELTAEEQRRRLEEFRNKFRTD